jgi:hypothetical protein
MGLSGGKGKCTRIDEEKVVKEHMNGCRRREVEGHKNRCEKEGVGVPEESV